jgi:hypothetical protein
VIGEPYGPFVPNGCYCRLSWVAATYASYGAATVSHCMSVPKFLMIRLLNIEELNCQRVLVAKREALLPHSVAIAGLSRASCKTNQILPPHEQLFILHDHRRNIASSSR